MNKQIQPHSHPVTFKCATCGSTYEIVSTVKGDVVNLDVCSHCHPFYVGASSDQKVKGRSEKLSAKFAAGLKNNEAAAKETKKEKSKAKPKIVTSFEDIA
ncbi:MAG: 50S ribosomal protein L31 [Mycoplasmataceae bacterium]|jgi:large subunit ribosomal protein L31|nr:50S ribosomal protein L31 [Mycoplasmataceae bacterium]